MFELIFELIICIFYLNSFSIPRSNFNTKFQLKFQRKIPRSIFLNIDLGLQNKVAIRDWLAPRTWLCSGYNFVEEWQNTATLLDRAELLVAMLIKRKLYPTVDRTKNVGRTFSNMGGQTVEQCWIEQSWSAESNFVR